LTIEHREDSKGVTRANVVSIAPPPPGVSPQLAGEPLLFDVNNWDNAALDRLPAWIQKAIKTRIGTEPAQKIEQPEPGLSDKSGAAPGEGTTAAEPDPDDGIPF
jgi:hypothetical protein